MITYSTQPCSIGAEILLVYAPCGSQCTFWAPTLIGDPSNTFLTPGMSMNGGQTTRSAPSSGPSAGTSASAKATASLGVLYIFQFPATIGKRINHYPFCARDFAALTSQIGASGAFVAASNSF